MSSRRAMASPIQTRRGRRVLVGTCECLAAGGTLPALERRKAEDVLADSIYREVPAPERDLLALAHILLRRGLVTESDLAERMHAVRSRLQAG